MRLFLQVTQRPSLTTGLDVMAQLHRLKLAFWRQAILNPGGRWAFLWMSRSSSVIWGKFQDNVLNTSRPIPIHHPTVLNSKQCSAGS